MKYTLYHFHSGDTHETGSRGNVVAEFTSIKAARQELKYYASSFNMTKDAGIKDRYNRVFGSVGFHSYFIEKA